MSRMHSKDDWREDDSVCALATKPQTSYACQRSIHNTPSHLNTRNSSLARVGLVLQLEFVAKEFDDEHLFTNDEQSNHTLPLVRRKLSQ